ncbi:TIGR03619 family F420-dependent LLM class oxidoreductase [Pseudonocardia dioxanivorans]|uniref:TIGR03619 family F420-dependent LLM class oxidoreductase n=1 Tax=Pseudonocardia dioxanivorans TaxID=240495 RepID=UPI000CD2A290|nr:TIGR03619 family F420-dependent LLM class oxidoreductase [Pseudonocardia dioxanivorans]
MRYTLNLAFIPPQNYLRAARSAEELGFDTIGISDSVFFPRDTSSKYPYNDDGGRAHFENAPFLDAFSIIPAMAAVTERIEFLPCVLKLPIRPPVVTAKLVMSTAVISNDRFKLGVGTSPWPEDYEATQIPWERRGHRLEEQIAIIRGLVAGGYHEFHGEFYDYAPIKMLPVPSRPVPILTGGHAPLALRRAAALGDGWIAPATGVSVERLGEMIEYIADHRRTLGRDGEPFEIHASYDVTPDKDRTAILDGIGQLEALGVTDVRIALRGRAPEPDPDVALKVLTDDAARFSEQIIRG